MLGLIRSWGDSLKLLAPSSLKVWGLLTLKGSLATYRLLIVGYWWLILFLGASGWFFSSYRYETVVLLLWCFLAVRSSIAKKDIKYFAAYWAHCLVALMLLAVVALLVLMCGYGNQSHYIVRYQGSCLLIITTVFALFFLFDAKVSFYSLFKSVWNGIKLVWYMLPLCILMCLGWQLVACLVDYVVQEFGIKLVLLDLVVCLFFPVYLHIFLYIYIKQIYTHPERYQ